MREALRIIVDRDGMKGLRRGMLPRILTVAPSTAISWMSYEFFSECGYAPSYECFADLLFSFARRGIDTTGWTFTRNGSTSLDMDRIVNADESLR
jgi:hypothetical protein